MERDLSSEDSPGSKITISMMVDHHADPLVNRLGNVVDRLAAVERYHDSMSIMGDVLKGLHALQTLVEGVGKACLTSIIILVASVHYL